MSGGHFEYAQYRINDISESIKEEIKENKKKNEYVIFKVGSYGKCN